MRDEYDFAKAERGKFYHPDAELRLPVHLSRNVLRHLLEKAESTGVEFDRIINDALEEYLDTEARAIAGRYPVGVVDVYPMEVHEKGETYDSDRQPDAGHAGTGPAGRVIHLSTDVMRYATEQAHAKGIAVEQWVNEILRKHSAEKS